MSHAPQHPDVPDRSDRRDFLRTVAVAGLAALPAGRLLADQASSAAPSPASTVPTSYLSLSGSEAELVERLVNIMCPADELTPDGTSCGLALFIDRQLAGPFGRGERLYLRGPWRPGAPQDGYQLPHTPEEHFKLGLHAFDYHCRQSHGMSFARLDVAIADAALQKVAAGEIASGAIDLGRWFNELVYPLFEQACFADPVYGGNRDKVFWKMIGYPGLPAVNGINMRKYRGKPFPGAARPRSIEDFG